MEDTNIVVTITEEDMTEEKDIKIVVLLFDTSVVQKDIKVMLVQKKDQWGTIQKAHLLSLTDEGPLRKDSETDLQQHNIQSGISRSKCPKTKVKLKGLLNVIFLVDTRSEISKLSETIVGTGGVYEYLWSFGLCNIPATFQLLMEACFREENLMTF